MNYPTVQIRQLEEVLGFTRQGYYQYWKRQAGQLTYDSEIILLVNENEYLAHQQVHSLAQAQSVLQQAIFLYNFKRPHLSCNMLVPEQAHQKEGKLKRRWKNTYYKKLLATHLDNQKQD
ncbi:MAG: integrase core domain-containing protein [Dyadobacter sp.]|uniref:integrase core domain-containing protein n=1 Tax=Dyadobacter sp. TaxID=1914288 RepID=UPI0032671DC9